MKLETIGGVVMPENYIAMFNAPERVEAAKIIKNADVLIKYIVGYQCPL